MEKLYDIKEAGEVLRLAPSTIRWWIKTGKLRAAWVGDRRVIRESELQKLIVDQKPKDTQKA
jgi:excisionase family DNA binding protein